MRGIARRRDRHHRTCLRHVGGSREHGGAAQAVADQDRRRTPAIPQRARRRQEIGDIGRERGVGELAFARTKPGEVETQHADAERGECLRNAARRRHVLAAGEAMREQRIGLRLPGRHVEERCEPLALGVDEVEPFGGHGSPPSRFPKNFFAPCRIEARRNVLLSTTRWQRSLNLLLP